MSGYIGLELICLQRGLGQRCFTEGSLATSRFIPIGNILCYYSLAIWSERGSEVGQTMIQCEKCGRENADQTQYCRFCGARLPATGYPQSRASFQDQSYSPPRPYAWKTDEYQTQTDARARPDLGPIGGHESPVFAQPMAHAPFTYTGANYRCPNCGTTTLPIIERRISTAGWITFALLLVFTVIFFWIGLLMKQEVSVCPVCRATVGP